MHILKQTFNFYTPMNLPAKLNFQNSLVLTTSTVAALYETETATVSNSFNRHKVRFQEGKHYYVLQGNSKRKFIDHHQIDDGSKKAESFYLWTEKGCLLHAKNLNTDKAWEVYEYLVDHYFSTNTGKSFAQLALYELPSQWEQAFPKSFFEQIYRLYALPQIPGVNHPQFFGHLINKYAYGALDKDLPKAIKEKRAACQSENQKAALLHQFFNKDGREIFVTHIHTIVGMMECCDTIEQFDIKFERKFYHKNQLEVNLTYRLR